MKKLSVSLVMFLLLAIPIFADGDLDKVVQQIPANVVFPFLTVSSSLNLTESYDLVFSELKNNKIGNSISSLQFTNLKLLISQKENILQEDTQTLECAKLTKGYYLKIVVNVGHHQVERATFELYNPTTLALICKTEIPCTFAWTLSQSGHKLIINGIKRLADEINKTDPSIIIK